MNEIKVPSYFECLRENDIPFVNLLNLEIRSEFDQEIKVGYKLNLEPGLTGCLTKTFSPEQFMKLSKCDTVFGMDDFDRGMLLRSYLFEGGFISVELLELEMTLDFRIVDGRTVVYSLSDHFYDETEEFWSAEGFEEYINCNERLLYAVRDCRNKMFNAARSDRRYQKSR